MQIFKVSVGRYWLTTAVTGAFVVSIANGKCAQAYGLFSQLRISKEYFSFFVIRDFFFPDISHFHDIHSI